MSLDVHELEKEVYTPVREIYDRNRQIDDPNLSKNIATHVDSFVEKNPELVKSRDEIYNMAIAHLHGYILGRMIERYDRELIKFGIDGAKFVIESYLKYRELSLEEKKLQRHEES